jgi:serine transporter
MMVLTVMFFVFSCVLSLSPENLAEAKAQNISILSYLANHFNAPVIAWMAPIIAMIALLNPSSATTSARVKASTAW